MFYPNMRYALGLMLLFLGASTCQGQGNDFILPYNKTPETAPEFWAATKFEMGLGNYGRSAEMLQKFYDRLSNLGEEEQNKLLLAVYDRDGLSPLLKLSNQEVVRKVLAKDAATGKDIPLADVLIKRMTRAIEGRLGDPGRIEFFVNNLSKSKEERAYAFSQLRIAGARAVPAMLQVLRNQSRQNEHSYIISALTRMDRNFAPPLLAALDAPDNYLRTTIITIFLQRADDRIVPHLWYLHGWPSTPATLRTQATQALSQFTRTPEDQLGDARVKLVEEGERYYQHQIDLPQETQLIWRWDKELGNVTAAPVNKSGAEEYFAIYWAKKALELDARFLPAQVLMISASVEKALERGGVSQPLKTASPEVYLLLAGTSPALLQTVLDRALRDGRSAVALGVIQVLGESGDPKLLRSGHQLTPLARALRFSDVRVQLAAADAALKIPVNEPYAGSSRVIEVLRRAIGGDGQPRVLIGHGNSSEGQRVAGLFRELGFDPIVVNTGADLTKKANESADFAMVAVDAALPEPGIAYTLSQLRENSNTSGLPIIVLAAENQARSARMMSERYALTTVLSPVPMNADLLKSELNPILKDTFRPPLTDAERKAAGPLALELLLKIATGEAAGYDARPAEASIIQALNSDELAVKASQVLAWRGGKTVQLALAETALREVRPPAVRAAALVSLRMHVARFGNFLTEDQTKAFAQLAKNATDPQVQEQAERLIALIHANGQQDGQRILDFTPPFPSIKAEAKPDAKGDDQ